MSSCGGVDEIDTPNQSKSEIGTELKEIDVYLRQQLMQRVDVLQVISEVLSLPHIQAYAN